MTRYETNDRGHLFRWDDCLHTWFRLAPMDDEYDAALTAVFGAAAAAQPEHTVIAQPKHTVVRRTRCRRTRGSLLARCAPRLAVRSDAMPHRLVLRIRIS